MSSPTPAVRAAIFGLFVVTALAVTGAALHLASADRAAQREVAVRLDARLTAAAAALAGLDPAVTRSRVRQLARPGSDDLLVVDAQGRLVAASDAHLARSVPWALRAGTPTPQTVSVGNVAYLMTAAPVRGGGHVVGIAPVPDRLPDGTVMETVLAATSMWGVLIGVLVMMAWYAGPRTATQLTLLGERIAQGDADGDALIRHARLWLGPLADAFHPVTGRFRALGIRAEDVKGHVAALYQINPHYVLLCGQDGEIIDANPAFYAVTGLSFHAVQGGRIEMLRQTFPIEPLMELAARSLREGSAITGIEYALIDRDDETRPVEVSLRGFELEGRPMVLVQATDQAHQKRLERRVAAFSDTLDLMVDQRVHQLSAGQQTLNRVLDAAGVIVASFDAGGGTSRWSGAAQVLTGRPIAQVGHFAAATEVMGLSPGERMSFTQWFWSPSNAPFVGRHSTIGADGVTHVRQILWQRVDADLAGRSDLRTLVGVEVPSYLDLPVLSGDGQAGALPV